MQATPLSEGAHSGNAATVQLLMEARKARVVCSRILCEVCVGVKDMVSTCVNGRGETVWFVPISMDMVCVLDMEAPTGGRLDGPMDGRTDGRMDAESAVRASMGGAGAKRVCV